jgi:predicted RND superfamily exporter protein
MKSIRSRIESRFESFAHVLFDHRYKMLVVMLFFVFLLAAQIPGIRMDTSTEGFLHETDPILIEYEEFRDQFGRDEMAIVAVRSENIFDIKFLEKLKNLHEDLRDNLPDLAEITSLINARNTHGKADELIVEDLFENWPANQRDLDAIARQAKQNQMYKNLLLSEDGMLTTIVLKTHTYSGQGEGTEDDLTGFSDEIIDNGETPGKQVYLTDKENSDFVEALGTIIDKHRTDDFPVFMAGSPVVTDFLKQSMMSNMRRFMGLALLTISVFLFVMFRRLSGVLMPVFIVMVSLVSTMGLMALTKVAIKIPTQILPSFLLSVAVGASVHILVMFFQSFDRGETKRDAIGHALGHSGLAILMTSLTTAGGLLSFSTAEVAPIADLGLFAAAGVILSLVYTLVFLPVLLSIFPIKSKASIKEAPGQIPVNGSAGSTGAPASMDAVLNFVARTSTQHPRKVLLTALALIIIALAGILKIELSHDPVRWLPDKSDVRISNEILDHELKGTTILEVIVDTKKENGLYDPDFMARLEQSGKVFESYKDDKVYVGKAFSLTIVVKETNQALHENNAEFYNVPKNKELIAQELFLFENSGSDDLEDFTDSQFSKARLTLKLPFVDAIAYSEFMDHVQEHFRSKYPDETVQITGMVAILSRVLTNAMHSMLKSYGYAFGVITILMILLIGRVKIGFFSMIPNIYPIFIMLGVMGWFHIPMDLFSMLVGSIAIGLAVDDTIHFMHNFRRYYEQYKDPVAAVYETLHTTGRAMLVTTCVLSIGFFTFMFSEMNNLFNFGFLAGFTLIIALLSDYFIAPALMVLLHKKKADGVSNS